MVADIARITYDPTRQYRTVVRQQGRVTLEADENEAATLASEALRLETIDIFGPAAAIGDGYRVGSASGPGGISIHSGIFYLGGWRLELDQTLELPGDPKAANPVTGNFAVALLLTEQSVGAVEDTALREVALGGPDSAARTRLMQRFVREQINGESCPEGQANISAGLGRQGVSIDATLQLVSSATLQAGFVPGPSSSDPCTPTAAGGYLGADNQLVRVTVIRFDPNTNRGTLLWGWNNASLLYRAHEAGDPQTLMLDTTPVDQEHAPQKSQMVEILKSELKLDTGDFIAAPQGFVTGVDQAYSFDTQEMKLNPGLPADYQNAANPLFVRLWQAAVEFDAGVVTPLDDVSGITVKIAMTALPDTLALRPVWRFAVRPSTPQNIYPERYSDGPVPPDGPRQWIAELAVMTALPGGGSQPLQDCRTPYPTAEGGCCSLTLDPSKDWLGTLNAAINDPKVSVVNVCFLGGEFEVKSTIKVSHKAVRMTGAGFRSVISGGGLEVVMEFDNCPEVGLFDLRVVAGTSGFSPSTGTKDLQGAVTIRSCLEVDIERVGFACADADLRSASCLAIYNPAPLPNAVRAPLASVTRYVDRVLNCRLKVGHCQAGILITNADVALIEGNYIENELAPVKVTIDQLASRPQIAFRLRKQVIHEMVLTNTAPPVTKNAKARARKREAKGKAAEAARKQEVKDNPQVKDTAVPAAPRTNLATIGRAHVTASFGSIHLKFLSSSALTDTWAGALRASGITATSKMGAIHKAVQTISRKMVTNPREVSPAAYNFINALLPQLYSTSSQGIVVGGNLANDVRILNNTIDGMVQGIHVGLSNVKEFGKRSGHLSATRVQIKGNTVNVRLTATDSLDRHGIYLGCVNSAVIADNHLTLTRAPNEKVAWYDIDAIKVSGIFGPLMLIERNCMLGFSTGIYTQENQTPNLQVPPLWKASDNYSDLTNQIHSPPFIVTNTVP